ncbi:hypothetical protein ACPTGA_13960, partial [Enterococcus faecalis]
HGAAHITGGGFLEKIPKNFYYPISAQFKLKTWPQRPKFKNNQKKPEKQPENVPQKYIII